MSVHTPESYNNEEHQNLESSSIPDFSFLQNLLKKAIKEGLEVKETEILSHFSEANTKQLSLFLSQKIRSEEEVLDLVETSSPLSQEELSSLLCSSNPGITEQVLIQLVLCHPGSCSVVQEILHDPRCTSDTLMELVSYGALSCEQLEVILKHTYTPYTQRVLQVIAQETYLSLKVVRLLEKYCTLKELAPFILLNKSIEAEIYLHLSKTSSDISRHHRIKFLTEYIKKTQPKREEYDRLLQLSDLCLDFHERSTFEKIYYGYQS